MLLGIYYALVNTTQTIVTLETKNEAAYGTIAIGNEVSDFYGVYQNKTVSAYLNDECRTKIYGTLLENPTRCTLEIVYTCRNTTTWIEMTGYYESELRTKNKHILEYALYCILVCLLANMYQFKHMSDLQVEKIAPITLQVNMIVDVVNFYMLLNFHAVFLDTKSAMVFYLGMSLFVQARLCIYMERSWLNCAFIGSFVYIVLRIQPFIGFIMLLLLSLLWFYQVWFCFFNGITPGLSIIYLFSNFCRLFPALYVWGCPFNIINFGNHFYQGFLLLFIIGTITLLISVQHVHPRFYLDELPLLKDYFAKYLKSSHNYVSELTADDDKNCGICLEDLEDDNEGYTLLNRVMRAPCDHLFHERCLKEWLQIKLQCPICRIEMPPI